jgi:hypothetical protein
MRRLACVVLVGVMLSARDGYAADAPVSGAALAETMRQARYSEGFEARLNVLVTKANGAHPAPFKLAVIGQMSAGRQRLLLRGIAPETVRDRFVAAQRGSDGKIRVVSYRAAKQPEEIDPQDKLFDSGLSAWDMFTPWWDWPKQFLQGKDRVGGRECEKIQSSTDEQDSAVREVESCVDKQAGISLRTRLFDAHHVLLRTTSVSSVMRKDNGAQAAKKIAITDAGKIRTDIEVYAGDEEYQVTAETFSALDRLSQDARQEAK